MTLHDQIDRIDLTDPLENICDKLGIDKTYVHSIHLYPTATHVHLFKGKDGFCQGAKYVDETTGEAAMEYRDYGTTA
jgi:hypothetical protein